MTIAVFLADDHAIVREGLERILNAEADIRVLGASPLAESPPFGDSALAHRR